MTVDKRAVRVTWTGRGMVFEGGTEGAPPITMDGDAKEGPSPTEALLMSVGACMAIDIHAILEKGRVPLSDLVVEVEGDRAPDPPRRFTRIRISIHAKGPGEEDLPKLERAAQLSHDKYCSVFHTLRSDLDVRIFTSRS